jgi:DNA-binding response OmpR family regulator
MHDESRILIVEDNPVNRTLLQKMLESEGFDTLAVDSGEDCLQCVVVERVDMILLDVKMRGIDGYETCRRLRENPDFADIPIIFITSLDSRDDILKGYQTGGVDFIPKPIDKTIVLARVKALLTMQGLLKERTMLLEQNSSLLAKIDHLFSGDQVTLFDKLDIVRENINAMSNSFYEQIQDVRLDVREQDTLDILDNIEISMQSWDTLHQQINEISKGIHQLYRHVKQRDGGKYDFEQIAQQSTEAVFQKQSSQSDVDDLLNSLL